MVDRHAAMVWDVCRSLIRDRHDAEDAFQATFLILVRKAGSLRVDETLGPWLHVVAYRTRIERADGGRRDGAGSSIRRQARLMKPPMTADSRGAVGGRRTSFGRRSTAEIRNLPEAFRLGRRAVRSRGPELSRSRRTARASPWARSRAGWPEPVAASAEA